MVQVAMGLNGRVIGIFVGSFLGGFPGLLLGLLIGHLHDTGLLRRWVTKLGIRYPQAKHSAVQQVFFDCTFAVMGYVAKADGRVSEQEIQAVERLMVQMGLSDAAKYASVQQFNRGKRPDFNLKATIDALKHACWRRPSLLRTFMEMQIQIANADGAPGPKKRQAIEAIYRELGLFRFNFEEFTRAYEQYSRQSAGAGGGRSSQRPVNSNTVSLSAAYDLLGVTTKASDAEVKRAYRRLMSKNHPDKLVSKGLPPEMIKLATQKTQRIKEAYETVRKARGA